MSDLIAYVSAIGVCGPGLPDWPSAEAVLSGKQAYVAGATVLPAPETLPSTERRRAGRVVRLALATGLEAARRAGVDPARLPVVFASSGGDGDNCDAICRTLASASRALSPTRFHNSVHNAPAGYWSIAAGSQVPTTTICAYDASFSAGLLEALAQAATTRLETALIAYDLDYPEPLHAARPTSAPFSAALILKASAAGGALARLTARFGRDRPDRPRNEGLARLAALVPAAQSLVLLEAIAVGRPATVNLGYLEPVVLTIEVAPWH